MVIYLKISLYFVVKMLFQTDLWNTIITMKKQSSNRVRDKNEGWPQ